MNITSLPKFLFGRHASAVVSVLVLLATFAVPVAMAQVSNIDEISRSAVTLIATPPRLGEDGTLVGQPGETLQVQVQVRNATNQPMTIATVAEDFIVGEDGRTPIPVEGQANSRWSLASWLQLPINTVRVPAQSSQAVPVIIQIPADALPGGRYAMIMHQPVVGEAGENAAEAANNAAKVTQRVGTLVYVRVAGDITENASIRNLTVPSLVEFGPVPISFEVENVSDVHIRPSIEVRIRNTFGQVVDTFLVEPQNVFPYTHREFTTQWDRVWGLGRYRVELQMVYGEQGQVVTISRGFWMIPLQLILTLFIVIGAAGAIAIAVRRHLKHRQDVSQQHIHLLEDRIRQLEEELHDPRG